jgi:hypothetical protein
MARGKRVNVKTVLADPDLRRELMVDTIRATQAREGIETTEEQAERAYYIVSEGEKTAFFDLERFRGAKDESDRRHEMFVRALCGAPERIRFNVARRDFSAIDGLPLAYRHAGLFAHLFREYPALEPTYGVAKLGGHTSEDERLVRYWWEVDHIPPLPNRRYIPFAKGGPFSRFYSDVFLMVAWDPQRRSFYNWFGREGRWIERPEALDYYFQQGLTWPGRTAKGLNVRRLPAGCIFAHKGPALFPLDERTADFLLGITNTHLFEYLFRCKTSFSWEVGTMKVMPIPQPNLEQVNHIGSLATRIHDSKASWDEGNEISTRFTRPWLLREGIMECSSSISNRLERLTEVEAAEDARIQKLYAELCDEVYRLYGIPDSSRQIIEETLGERPPEIIWPQMEGRTVEQKRMEHVWRLLSYVVKRVVEADEDGIVPFVAVSGEMTLLERVHQELAVLFVDRDVNQVEVEVTNELRRRVKGYNRSNSIREWLEDEFFHYHVALYKNRPIIWHISSKVDPGEAAFAAIIQYHKFDRNRMAKLRSSYVREALNVFRREAGLASQEGRANDRLEWQSKIEITEALDQRLQQVQEGQHEGAEGSDRDFRILTPWKSTDERPKGWDPDLDDGVKVNIEPLQRADVL